MATTMITGGTGFIGQHLARLLLAAGDNVVLFDLSPDRDAIREMAERVTIVRGDVTLLPDLLRAVKQNGVERIAHLAYILGPDNEQNPPLALRVNAIGNNNVFEVARIEGLQRVTWTSSVSLYGRSSGNASVDEDDPAWPVRVYGALKLLNENIAEHYYREFGLEHIAVRPSSVYGPGRLRGSLQYLMDWMAQAARGEPVRVHDVDEMDNWSYVEDVAGALAAAVLAPSLPERRIFNIGGDYRSRRDFASYLQVLCPDAKIEAVSGGADHYRPRHLNHNIAEQLGFRPAWSMENGVKSTVNWYRELAGRQPLP